ncbi:capsid maturation protease and MuF-like fusion protein [Mycobacterium phage Serendipitous]|uniref:Capsid maturation protease and MuF-like fusion protein n=1 Tax=Mycobacterium phage Serendipitous TaxID=2301619 RepID=A0A385UIA9_9CAUD|nr:portal protein [Mycobacterium phage Serendipitous]AYB70553.1 capsid maturation protease and MuF-like fusion protein [Mycobacterium phage Serendipitous]
MFPEPGEAINRTIEAEAALTDLYAEALNQWVAETAGYVLPELPQLTASTLPPDPNAVVETSGRWDQLAETLILSGLVGIFALSILEAASALDIELPTASLGASRARELPEAVVRSLVRTTEATVDEIERAWEKVQGDPYLKQACDDFIETQRATVAATPDIMASKVQSAMDQSLRDAPVPTADSPEPTVTVMIERQRDAVAEVMTPGSEAVRDVSRNQGYQAASVQNAAVVTAAAMSEDADELDKVWIATIDGRTRPTHFAADGQRAPLAGSFTVGGTHLAYPADPTGPAAEVKNCRCRVGILAHDEELPSEVDRHTERLSGRDATARNRTGSQADEIERRAERGTVRARDDEDGIGRTAAGPPTEEHDMTVGKSNKFQHDGGEATTTLAASEDDGEEQSETFRTFTDAVIALLGVSTSDDRMIATDAELSYRSFPHPLMWMKQTGSGYGGHTEAFTVGAIESARVEGDKVLGSGYLLNTPEADEAAGELAHKVTAPSVDLAQTEWKLTDEDGNEITEEEWWDLPIDAKVLQCITAAELIGTTLVAKPAFGDTSITLNAERESRDIAVVASAAEEFRPRVYPAEMFAAPGLTEPTLPTMDPETGRFYGHLACFGACHRSIQSKCVMAPKSPSDYAHFHTSPAVRLDDGRSLPVGRLTVGTGHAPDHVNGRVAAAHYDNTGACFALVRVYETEVGIEFSGVAHPQATPEQIEMGITAPLSGDWRDFGQGLELVAALAVNTPGFAARGREDSMGRPVALVASLGPAPSASAQGQAALTAESISEIVEAAFDRATAKAKRAAEADGLMAAAASKVGAPPPEPEPVDEVEALLARAR